MAMLGKAASAGQALLAFATQRLRNNAGIMAATFAGLVTVIALTVGIPLYADGIGQNLLARTLADQGEGAPRPPYAFLVRYDGSWSGSISWAAYEKANAFMVEQSSTLIGLPLQMMGRSVTTDKFQVFSGAAEGARLPLSWAYLGFVDDIEQHAMLVEGVWPAGQLAAGEDSALPIAIAQGMAETMGIPVGEEFVLMRRQDSPQGRQSYQLTVRVVGVWRATDREDVFWHTTPSAYDDVLLVSEQSFVGRLAELGESPVYMALWYQVYNGRGVHTQAVAGLLGRIGSLQARLRTILPNTNLDLSPAEALAAYVNTARVLTVLLYTVAIPIVWLALYFVSLMSRLAVQRDRNEIAALRSRGVSVRKIIALYLMESAIVAAVAFVAGAAAGRGVALLMSASQGFLDFGSPGDRASVIYTAQSLRPGLAAASAAVVLSVFPALEAASHSIITRKQEAARSLKRPWWQSFYLDGALFLVALYGYYVLKMQGGMAIVGPGASNSSDLFGNPLLFLAPTIFLLALALLFVRLFPILTGLAARWVNWLPGAAPVIAVRQLSRSWIDYVGPLVLLVFTSGLLCFGASLASTLDQALTDATYYEVGADLRLVELGEAVELDAGRGEQRLAGSLQQPNAGSSTGSETFWEFLPVTEHLKARGVLGAARLAMYRADVRLAQTTKVATVLGVDPTDFRSVAYYRHDFGASSLGVLMNQIAAVESGVVAPRSFLATYGLAVGDSFTLHLHKTTQHGIEVVPVPVQIAGISDMFPTAYPADGPFLVASLDYLFDCLGELAPYDVLLRTAPEANRRQIISDLTAIGFQVLRVTDARAAIQSERQWPQRQGVLGLLSVGCIASALLSVLGMIVFAAASFRRRAVELAVMRAVGLPSNHVSLLVVIEQTALALIGIAVGVCCGVLSSSLFIGLLATGYGQNAQTPPFAVHIAWRDILLLHALLAAGLLILVAVLARLPGRIRIPEALKLGEAFS